MLPLDKVDALIGDNLISLPRQVRAGYHKPILTSPPARAGQGCLCYGECQPLSVNETPP
jgi:hypothetical protein